VPDQLEDRLSPGRRHGGEHGGAIWHQYS
jgi:hypothetical protein